ncbi:DUF3841 domain-containing protein [Aeromicrobium sp. NPDC092404]|uniref:DUF3841 domain-containing protein n=1 Tax=Aeromicrobium sp. NPDC092404 TaxID=3154976 RepID=UPI00341B108C
MTTYALPLPRARFRPAWVSTKHDPEGPDLLLQSVQHRSVFQDLLRTGIHRPGRWPNDHDLAEGYEWMAGQMEQRLPTTGEGIVWMWAQGRRADLKTMGLSRDDVLLRCRVPRDRVLVSHFSDWHCVLNRTLLVESLPGERSDAYGRRVEPLLDEFFERLDAHGLTHAPVDTWPAYLREEVEASWLSIFEPCQWSGRDLLQATLHEIRAEDVVGVSRLR